MGSISAGDGTFVALLRGINVGGKNSLPMKDLLEMFSRAGCAAVRTYIQSGNVVFEASPHLARQMPKIIGAEIEATFGLRVPLLIRSRAEIGAVARGNPFLARGVAPQFLHVVFLAEEPGTKDGSALDPGRSPPDAFVLKGREIYLSCPKGVGKTRLTNAYFDSTLKTTSTSRNWRTVLELRAMSEE